MRKSNAIDLCGQRFGRLVVQKRVESDKKEKAKWLCVCDCGNEKETYSSYLKTGDTKSCGCLEKEAKKTNTFKHGLTANRKQHPLYRKWASIKERCTNPNYKFWNRYGGRGISMCEEWINDPQAFYAFMGDKPFPDAEVDRIDNNGNYEPSNVRWATRKENCRNTSDRKEYLYDGVLRSIPEWAEEWSMTIASIRARIRRGWTKEAILNTPILKKGEKRCATERSPDYV